MPSYRGQNQKGDSGKKTRGERVRWDAKLDAWLRGIKPPRGLADLTNEKLGGRDSLLALDHAMVQAFGFGYRNFCAQEHLWRVLVRNPVFRCSLFLFSNVQTQER